ncbi:MAG: hypothetical protein ACK4NR_12395 [Micavibrio sp.]
MSVNMDLWFLNVWNSVDEIADEGFQRQAWFGIGDLIGSPSEAFNRFFSDAAMEDFIQRKDTGLNTQQLESLINLTKIMKELSNKTPVNIDTEIGGAFVDDPRWVEVREEAKKCLKNFGAGLDSR